MKSAADRGQELQRGRAWARGLGWLVAAMLALSSSSAWAEPSDKELEQARKTFGEGKALEKKSAWADALEKFQQVAGVKMTPQVRFHIALCEEHLGRLVSAIGGFQLATEEAKRAGSSAAEVAEQAPKRIAALKKRIAALRIQVKGSLVSSTVTIDGVSLDKAALASAIDVDPGKHVVELRSKKGESAFRQEVSLREGGTAEVEITANDPPPELQPAKSSKSPSPSLSPPPPAPPSRLPVYITGGAGVAFLVGAGVFYGLRESAIAEVQASCKGPDTYQNCDPALRDTADAGRTYTTISIVSLGVGAAALAASSVLWITLRPKTKEPSSTTAISVSPYGPGMMVRGSF